MKKTRGRHVKENPKNNFSKKYLIPSVIMSSTIMSPLAGANTIDHVPGVPSKIAGSVSNLTETGVQPVPYTTRVVEDPNLPAGIETVIQEGKDGTLKTVTGFKQSAGFNGSQHLSKIKRTYIDTPATEKVILKGTKTEVIQGVSNKVLQAEALLAQQKKVEEQAQAEASKTAEPSSTEAKTEAQTNTEVNQAAKPVTGTKTDWMKAAGIPESDWHYVDYIISHESGWDPNAVNVSSGATGLPQSLPGNKMATMGEDWATNPVTQLKWANWYATSRYGSWAQAYNAWKTQNWW